MANQYVFRLLTELTSNKWLSRLIGLFTKTKISRLLLPWYIKSYNIAAHEAELPLTAYPSLNEFFIRRLKPGSRSIDQHPASLVSPVDATVTGIGSIHSNITMIVKDQSYDIEELLDHFHIFGNYNGGFFIVLYLSPADYHRIHSPVAGTIIGNTHVHGRTYPVNEFGLKRMRRVLSRNERLITYMQHDFGMMAMIKVGAMNVSSIHYAEELPAHPHKGDELAYFEFGSTVVLLIENGDFQFRDGLEEGSKVLVGEALGYWGKGF